MEQGEAFGFTVVSRTAQYGAQVNTTDPDLLKLLQAEIHALLPNCHLELAEDLEGRLCTLKAGQLNGQDSELGWWIVKNLCDRGWEPYEMLHRPWGDDYHLRKKCYR